MYQLKKTKNINQNSFISTKRSAILPVQMLQSRCLSYKHKFSRDSFTT